MPQIKSILFLLCCMLGISSATGQAPENAGGLTELTKRAVASHTDAMLVLRDGKVLDEYYSANGKSKTELMSCTKSIVSFGIGRLIDQGKIKSLDQPVYEFYPEWKQGRKQGITIRHLLNHTSGLENVPNTSVEIYPSPDFIKLALAAELTTDPGAVFSYNNKAVNLLAGIIQKASGKRMDFYFRDEIFKPMGIVDYAWSTDKAGNPQVMAGLQLSARDFAKFGELVLNKGLYGKTRIVSEHWLEEAMTPQATSSYGLMWWLTPGTMDIVIDDKKFKEFEAAGVDASLVKKLEPLRNKVMHSQQEFSDAVTSALNVSSPSEISGIIEKEIRSKGLRLANFKVFDVTAYSANGYLGQYLVIYPKEKLVAVRQIRSSRDYNEKTDGFQDFLELVGKSNP